MAAKSLHGCGLCANTSLLTNRSPHSPSMNSPQQQWSTYCSRLAHGRIVLIGDAGHSMWASLGQGVNAALGEEANKSFLHDGWTPLRLERIDGEFFGFFPVTVKGVLVRSHIKSWVTLSLPFFQAFPIICHCDSRIVFRPLKLHQGRPTAYYACGFTTALRKTHINHLKLKRSSTC